jgi:hypothetical protein
MFHQMGGRRSGGDSLGFPVPRHSPLCGIKLATRRAEKPAQVMEHEDEEVYRVLSEWTQKVCSLETTCEHNLYPIYSYVTHWVIDWF